MKILTTGEGQNLETKNNIDNYYLLAMLLTAVLLMGVAYYDQIVSSVVR